MADLLSPLSPLRDAPSLLLRSLPPVALPLALLLAATGLLLTTTTRGPKSPPPPGGTSSEELGRRQSQAPLRLLSAAAAILALLASASAADEIWSRRGILGSVVPTSGGSSVPPPPPALPPRDDPDYDAVRSSLVELQRRRRGRAKDDAEPPTNDAARGGGGSVTALVTGASGGIGRALAYELARRRLASTFVLVGRDNGSPALDDVAADLRECYGASRVTIVRADLSLPGEARRVHAATAAAGLNNGDDDDGGLRYLVLCAGWGPTADLVELGAKHGEFTWEGVTRLNVESAAVMAGLYGLDMVETAAADTANKAGASPPPRILLVSSVTGLGEGIPGVSLYAATKAFLSSLGRSLALELEPRGVSVTTVCPGATLTNFASRSGMADGAVWNFPLGFVMMAGEVARGGVDAMLAGRTEYIPGLINAVTVRAVVPLLPTRVAMKLYRLCWEPWPFAFPPGWRRVEDAAGGVGGEDRLVDDGFRQSEEEGGGGGKEEPECRTTEEASPPSATTQSSPADPSARVLVVEDAP